MKKRKIEIPYQIFDILKFILLYLIFWGLSFIINKYYAYIGFIGAILYYFCIIVRETKIDIISDDNNDIVVNSVDTREI